MTSTTVEVHRDRAARQALVRAQVPEQIERLSWSTEQIEAHQQAGLRALLAHAVARSPFHAERLRGVAVDEMTLADLPSLPVMTKAEMMAAFDQVLTDPTVSKASADAHVSDAGVEGTELAGRFTVLASGGSSGQRGLFVLSRQEAAQFVLAVIRPGLARAIALLGALPDEPPAVAIIAAGSAVHATRVMPSLFGGDLNTVTSFSATAPLEGTVDGLNALQPAILQGYPSVVRRLADEQLAGRLEISPLTVTTTSELLDAEARAHIDRAFGVGVCDVLGTSEGLLGQSPPDDPAIVLASDLCIVELVDGDGRPVVPGTPADRVLVTNLYNHTQPLIRYELTDVMTEVPGGWPDGHLRVRVAGRADDELRWGDVTVHPLAVRTVVVKDPAVSEHQVRQTTRGIDVACVAVPGATPDVGALAAGLRRSLASAGLPEPEVVVRLVGADALERHPETGKTRRFISLAG